MEQNCENLHLKDTHVAKNVIVEQSHQNTCRECTRESVRGKKCFFVSRKKCFPVLAAAHPEFCAYIFQPFFRQKEFLENKENKKTVFWQMGERFFLENPIALVRPPGALWPSCTLKKHVWSGTYWRPPSQLGKDQKTIIIIVMMMILMMI